MSSRVVRAVVAATMVASYRVKGMVRLAVTGKRFDEAARARAAARV